jgi:hypothetical protein
MASKRSALRQRGPESRVQILHDYVARCITIPLAPISDFHTGQQSAVTAPAAVNLRRSPLRPPQSAPLGTRGLSGPVRPAPLLFAGVGWPGRNNAT